MHTAAYVHMAVKVYYIKSAVIRRGVEFKSINLDIKSTNLGLLRSFLKARFKVELKDVALKGVKEGWMEGTNFKQNPWSGPPPEDMIAKKR